MRSKTQMLTLASVFAAIILVTVMFPFLRILNEYAHIGDGVIYLACAILPAPYAMLAAAAGAALAELLGVVFALGSHDAGDQGRHGLGDVPLCGGREHHLGQDSDRPAVGFGHQRGRLLFGQLAVLWLWRGSGRQSR